MRIKKRNFDNYFLQYFNDIELIAFLKYSIIQGGKEHWTENYTGTQFF